MAANRRQDAVSALRESIASGKLAPGDRVGPSLEVIAREYGVGKTTMQGVLSDLAAEGIVRRDHGVGYFVSAVPDSAEPGDGLAAEVARLRSRVSDLEVDVMDLYSTLGYEHPSQRQEERRERAG